MAEENALGSFIKQVRKVNSLTQDELAELSGVSQASIVKYENGSDPGIKFLRAFRNLFGYDLVDENITSVIPTVRYDKVNKKPLFKKEKSGSYEPDIQLLTLMKKQVDDLKVNFEKLALPPQAPPAKNGGRKKGVVDILEDTRQKVDK